jgi:hypothetical protein
MRRKQRTRAHIIADLSTNAVERIALLCGYSVERFFTDLARWLLEAMPIMLVLFEAQTEIVYWTYVQAYFRRLPEFDLTNIGATYTMYLRKADIVDIEVMKQFAQYKAQITRQMTERNISHEA